MSTSAVQFGEVVSGYSGASQTVFSGGTAVRTIVSGSCRQTVSSGGTAISAIVVSGGVQKLREGTAIGTVLSGNVNGSYGAQQTSSGGSALGTLVSSGGLLNVETGGYASGTSVFSGGLLDINAGGTALGVVQHEGGNVNVTVRAGDGAFVKGVNGEGGAMLLSNGIASSFVLYEVYDNETWESVGICQMDVISGGIASGTVISGGRQNIYAGGTAVGTTLDGLEAWQSVDSGGTALNTVVLSSGQQHVGEGGIASGTVVSASLWYSGGSQVVESGGISIDTVLSGGFQGVQAGGTAISTVVCDKGRQYASAGAVVSGTTARMYGSLFLSDGIAYSTVIFSSGEAATVLGGIESGAMILSGGTGKVSAGGTAIGAVLSEGGLQTVGCSGLTIGTVISFGGVQRIDTHCGAGLIASMNPDVGGTAFSTIVLSGGRLEAFSGASAVAVSVAAGARLHVSSGGKVSSAFVQSGGTAGIRGGGFDSGSEVEGKLVVNAGASGTGERVLAGGVFNVAGTNDSASVFAGGLLNVKSGGNAAGAAVSSGARINVMTDGLASGATVQKSALLAVYSGASAKDFTLAGRAVLRGGAVLDGTFSVASGAVVSGGADERVSLASGARLEAAGARMDRLHLDAQGAALRFTGPGNRIGSVLINKATSVLFDVARIAPGKRVILAADAISVASLPSFGVLAAKAQAPGVYALCSFPGMPVITARASCTLTVGEQSVNTPMDGTAVSAGGMDWRLQASGTVMSLSAAVREGAMLRDAVQGRLDGTGDGDVFFGGAGSDVIAGSGGRDCAVWGAETWGQDTVAETSGTMTMVFSGLAEADVTSSFAGDVMSFVKTADASQTITVNGWAAETHSVVFAESGTMASFSEWATAAAPTAAQETAARSEVWKKAGLAAA